ncbi:MAG: diguanylate cyclase [Spirochaetales bacterium]
METLFDPSLYQFDARSLPVLGVGGLLIVLGMLVTLQERASALGFWYLAFSWSVGVYCLGAGFSYAALEPHYALAWERFAHVGVSLIPGTFFVVTALILGKVRRYFRFSVAIGLVSLLMALASGLTNLVVASNFLASWGYYPSYGLLGIVNVLFFVVVLGAIYVLYIRDYRKSRSTTHRRRLRGLMLALGIGYFGAVDYLPTLGIEVYAFGYVPIFLFVLSIGVVLRRYRLVDITPELAASQILKTLRSPVVVADLEGVVRVANDGALQLLRTAGQPVLESPISSVLPGALPPVPFSDVEYRLEKEGTVVTLSLSSSLLTDARGTPLGTIFAAYDLTALKESQTRLEVLALHDALTGLPNRVLLFDRMSHLIALSSRESRKFAVLYMDLDRFKAVNDLHGHAVGDALLVQVASRLKGCIRDSDTVARVGGDEFVAVCPEVGTQEALSAVAEKIVQSLQTPFRLDGLVVTIGVSIGISFYPDNGLDPDNLLTLADRAMYNIKQAGRGDFRFTP